MSDRKDLPPASAPNFESRVRETVMTYLGRIGDPLDRGVTLRDLLDSGLAKLRAGRTVASLGNSGAALPIEPPPAQEVEPDLTPPPPPTGFAVSAAISNIFIEHDAPAYQQGHGHLRTRVYGKIVAQGDPLPVFADAVEITQFTGTVHAYPSNPSTQWRLWIKWESRDGVLSVSPAGGTNGLEAVTGQDVSAMVAAMTGPGNPFTVLDEPTVIGGVTFPAGTYSTQAFIRDLQVTNAKIGNLAVDDAKIADLSVAKLTGAEMKVGSFIQSTNYNAGASGSGWRINADGAAEFNNVVVRGQVIGSAITGGTVDGAIITGATLRTAVSGQRIELDANGLLFLTGATSGKYGQFKYGEKKYGTGVLVYFNNTTKRVPFYVGAEQNVADIHLYNRGSNPTGGTYEAGDMIVVNGRLRIYVPALGGWKQVALEP